MGGVNVWGTDAGVRMSWSERPSLAHALPDRFIIARKLNNIAKQFQGSVCG